MTDQPRTAAGRALLEQEAENSRAFPLITVAAILAIEAEAAAAPLPDNADEYIALRQKGLRLPSRRDLLQRLDDCEQALRDTERALAAATPSALDVERLRNAIKWTGLILVDQVSGKPVDDAEEVVLTRLASDDEEGQGE